MKTLALASGESVFVDDGDYEEVSRHRWRHVAGRYAGRQISGQGTRRWELMHRRLLGVTADQWVGHADGNGLNNQRSNLRIATPSENQGNRKLGKSNTTGFKGIYRVGRRWRAYLRKSGRAVYSPRYDSATDAARAYDELARKTFGSFALTNEALGLLGNAETASPSAG